MITPALSGELFRYRGAAKDGGTLKYVFEAGEQNSPNAVTKEKVAEIAADFMTTFYHVQVGALETQEFRTTPVPFWLVSFSDTIKGLVSMVQEYTGVSCGWLYFWSLFDCILHLPSSAIVGYP
jgi:hypothetical protein